MKYLLLLVLIVVGCDQTPKGPVKAQGLDPVAKALSPFKPFDPARKMMGVPMNLLTPSQVAVLRREGLWHGPDPVHHGWFVLSDGRLIRGNEKDLVHAEQAIEMKHMWEQMQFKSATKPIFWPGDRYRRRSSD